LDGEMVVAGENGVADFQALQNAFDRNSDEQISYYLFDLLYLDGKDLRESPLQERRDALQALLEKSDAAELNFSRDFDEPVDSLLDSACRLALEGLIGKRADSPYIGRRSSDWVKLKCKQRQEFVIVGFTDPKGSRSGFGALLLALHDNDSGELRYAGKVGTGFSATTLDSIHARLKPLEGERPALANPPTGAEARGVHWLQPRLLAEVAFAQMTREGIVRHAVFHGLRDDKPATAIDLERPMPNKKTAADTENLGSLRLTHPERVIDPSSGATKRQVAEYYAEVADWILPHLAQRPVALVRAPDGLAGELFFQKNAGQLGIPNIVTYDKAEAGQAVMIINRPDTLLGAVQMNMLELHTWNATEKNFDKPDRFVLDLDPDPALPWKAMLEATHLTLTLLDELGLQSFLKTSGGKGMHVVVPLTRRAGWDEVKDFSHAIVDHLAGLFPDRLSAVSGPKNRVGRIFIDYLRNGKGATTACAYTLRAREGLPVSVPIWREELAQLKGANQWNLFNLRERLAEVEDPWADFATTRQSITARMRKQLGLS
ncbi:MAG TPA: DNA ligase D, partial [Pseudomonas sp.]|uniref:DNA ligase D n=1 Tax=Pseudomonas sp. TaxID=306 RepID=UPI002B4A13CF